MTLKIEDEYANSQAGDSNYPWGSFINISAAGLFDGTPLEKAWTNDIYGFIYRLITEAGVTPSGNPDTVLASDAWDALEILLDLIDDKYLPNNVEKLLLNDTSATPGDAFIGSGYKAPQYYGYLAEESQNYGHGGIGSVNIGQLASGILTISRNATGAIEIGSTAGSDASKKLISGAVEATFKEIIDGSKQATTTAKGVAELATNAEAIAGTDTIKTVTPAALKAATDSVIDAQTDNYTTASLTANWTGTIKYRKVMGGNFVHIVGSAIRGSGAADEMFTLPVGSRPPVEVRKPLTESGASTTWMKVETTGDVETYTTSLQTVYIDELIHII